MIGIDSNVLIRYLLDDDPVWSPIATRFIEDELTPANPGYINIVVLIETIWTIRRSPLFDRAKLATLIDDLLLFDKFVIAESEAVAHALVRFRAGGMGFADALIGELNAAAGADVTITADKTAAKASGFQPLH